MISTVLFYNLIIALIGTFQYFTQAFVISNGRGDPDNATLFFNLNLYREAFVLLRHGLRLGAGVAAVRDRPRPDAVLFRLVGPLGLRGRRRRDERDRPDRSTSRLARLAAAPPDAAVHRDGPRDAARVAVVSLFLMPLLS